MIFHTSVGFAAALMQFGPLPLDRRTARILCSCDCRGFSTNSNMGRISHFRLFRWICAAAVLFFNNLASESNGSGCQLVKRAAVSSARAVAVEKLISPA